MHLFSKVPPRPSIPLFSSLPKYIQIAWPLNITLDMWHDATLLPLLCTVAKKPVMNTRKLLCTVVYKNQSWILGKFKVVALEFVVECWERSWESSVLTQIKLYIARNISLTYFSWKFALSIYPSSFNSVHFWTKIVFLNAVKCNWGPWGAANFATFSWQSLWWASKGDKPFLKVFLHLENK